MSAQNRKTATGAAQLKQWFSSGGNPIYIPRKTRYKNAKKRK